MDLTRDFIEKIEEMTAPTIEEIDGHYYTNKNLHHITQPKAAPLYIKTLTSLIAYLQDNRDILPLNELIINVVDDRHIVVYSSLDSDMKRDIFLQVDADTPELYLNDFMDREEFNIMLQANFVDAHDRANVLSVIGSMKMDNSVQVDDDGVTQTVSSSSGVVLVKEEKIPNPVTLAPFRTFSEIEQPKSSFVLRVNDRGRVGLFEADGGAWRNTAMLRIKEYLDNHLNEGKTGEEKLFSIIA